MQFSMCRFSFYKYIFSSRNKVKRDDTGPTATMRNMRSAFNSISIRGHAQVRVNCNFPSFPHQIVIQRVFLVIFSPTSSAIRTFRLPNKPKSRLQCWLDELLAQMINDSPACARIATAPVMKRKKSRYEHGQPRLESSNQLKHVYLI